jgi:hypothetical protein
MQPHKEFQEVSSREPRLLKIRLRCGYTFHLCPSAFLFRGFNKLSRNVLYGLNSQFVDLDDCSGGSLKLKSI